MWHIVWSSRRSHLRLDDVVRRSQGCQCSTDPAQTAKRDHIHIAGYNPILINLYVSYSRLFHMSSMLLLGGEFSGFVEFKKLFRGISLLPGTRLCNGCVVSRRDLFMRLTSVCLADKQHNSRFTNVTDS